MDNLREKTSPQKKTKNLFWLEYNDLKNTLG